MPNSMATRAPHIYSRLLTPIVSLSSLRCGLSAPIRWAIRRRKLSHLVWRKHAHSGARTAARRLCQSSSYRRDGSRWMNSLTLWIALACVTLGGRRSLRHICGVSACRVCWLRRVMHPSHFRLYSLVCSLFRCVHWPYRSWTRVELYWQLAYHNKRRSFLWPRCVWLSPTACLLSRLIARPVRRSMRMRRVWTRVSRKLLKLGLESKRHLLLLLLLLIPPQSRACLALMRKLKPVTV
mmetsp:Transcript_1155/g.3538  ORF Transcript_1155/g.3538 Transcript_1155/m.3538 type:complete len:237 (+) Transcript_1155:932-1642(+)